MAEQRCSGQPGGGRTARSRSTRSSSGSAQQRAPSSAQLPSTAPWPLTLATTLPTNLKKSRWLVPRASSFWMTELGLGCGGWGWGRGGDEQRMGGWRWGRRCREGNEGGGAGHGAWEEGRGACGPRQARCGCPCLGRGQCTRKLGRLHFACPARSRPVALRPHLEGGASLGHGHEQRELGVEHLARHDCGAGQAGQRWAGRRVPSAAVEGRGGQHRRRRRGSAERRSQRWPAASACGCGMRTRRLQAARPPRARSSPACAPLNHSRVTPPASTPSSPVNTTLGGQRAGRGPRVRQAGRGRHRNCLCKRGQPGCCAPGADHAPWGSRQASCWMARRGAAHWPALGPLSLEPRLELLHRPHAQLVERVLEHVLAPHVQPAGRGRQAGRHGSAVGASVSGFGGSLQTCARAAAGRNRRPKA